ncbi:hypothetical protein TcasGA2_TC000465 [Tribolium castaneum]|uniref:Uncharacterized protein n=1 Tax=Tribolium castaneum TaxID=7070 RepID=D6WA52_TRICA|nr:hypothetical protein TcasGA2_TC000465 [Tribolium castaneum]
MAVIRFHMFTFQLLWNQYEILFHNLRLVIHKFLTEVAWLEATTDLAAQDVIMELPRMRYMNHLTAKSNL